MVSILGSKDTGGFTIIELMLVVAVIGLLATIAIPAFVSYRKRANNATANADIKNLFTSAQAYYTENPSSATTALDDFKAYGFRQTSNVDLTIQGSGSQGAFSADSFHSSGNKTYHLASDGNISTSS